MISHLHPCLHSLKFVVIRSVVVMTSSITLTLLFSSLILANLDMVLPYSRSQSMDFHAEGMSFASPFSEQLPHLMLTKIKVGLPFL